MKLEGHRLVVLVDQGFEDLEFWVPVMRLREEGAEVVVAGREAGAAFTGKHGLTATTDAAAGDLEASAFDGVVVPGGWAPDKLRRDAGVTGLVQAMYAEAKVVAQICHAGLVGISAGIVEGHRATGSLGIKDDLVNAGATWVDEPAFRDGHLVWGRVVADIPAFCRVLVQALVAEATTEPSPAEAGTSA
jgi:protease I